MKRWLQKWTWLCLLLVFAGFSCGLMRDASSRPQVFLPDAITGYAIGGHDPVSYFVDGFPRKGSREFEFTWGGAEWIFVNEGNMAAFARDPEAYAPRYGGCGGYALTDGFASAGSPFIYAVVDGRLVFFHTVVNRFLFLSNATVLLLEAEAHADKVGCGPDM